MRRLLFATGLRGGLIFSTCSAVRGADFGLGQAVTAPSPSSLAKRSEYVRAPRHIPAASFLFGLASVNRAGQGSSAALLAEDSRAFKRTV
jgi:hypothetical protein